jgi:uncharacterized protein YecE (DUF72 family)
VNGQSGELRVGCSGWSYRDWRGIVYPSDLPASRWFAAYAELFDTVELNNTFYRLPPESTFDRWRDQAPRGFVYAVKVGAFGTHRKKLRDSRGWLDRHLDRVRRLGAAAGPQLVQLPPRWRRDVPRLAEFLDATPDDVRWAVEMRDRSWLHDDVYDVLRRHDAALCIHDLLSDHPWELTASWVYVRFHGPDPDRPYHDRYGGRRLWRAADRLAEWRNAGRDVFAYFNNDFHGHAVADARWLRERIAHEARVASPGTTPG